MGRPAAETAVSRPPTDRPRWPSGYRILLWLVGSIAVTMLIAALVFLLNAPR